MPVVPTQVRLWSPFLRILMYLHGSFSVLESLLQALFCACFFASDAISVPNSCQLPGVPPYRLAGVGLVSLSMAVPSQACRVVPFFELPSQHPLVSVSCSIWVAGSPFFCACLCLRTWLHYFSKVFSLRRSVPFHCTLVLAFLYLLPCESGSVVKLRLATGAAVVSLRCPPC